MSIRLRPRAGLVVGCTVAFGCLFIPRQYSSSLSLTCVSVFAPAQKVMARAGRSLGSSLSALSARGSGATEKRDLERKVAELTARLAQERAKSRQMGERLEALAESLRFIRAQKDLTARLAERIEEAEVMGEGAGAQRGILFVDRGSDRDMRKGMVVVAGRSVVGTVRATSPSVSSVLLVTGAGSRFDGEIAATGERGIVCGNGDGTMSMKHVSKVRPEPGMAVVTRGRTGLTPKHLLLGLVTSAKRRPGSLAYEVVLKPVRDLRRLVTVLVVKPALSAADFPARGGGGAAPND